MTGTAEEKTEVKSTETENQGESTETENQELKGVQFEDGEELEVETKTETPEEKEIQAPTTETKTEAEKEAINQEAVQKKIDKITFKRREAEEKAEAAQAELIKAQETIKKLKGESDKIVVPPLPDPLDSDFAEKMRVREEALQRQAELNAQQKLESERQREALLEKQQAAQREIQKNVDNMYTSAEKMGFKKEDFQVADAKVGKFVKSPELANFILEQEDSPLIVQYLSSNIEALEKLGRLDPIRAAAYIVGDISGKAQALKPKPSTTPEPLEIVKGKGGGEEESPFLEGVTLE